METSVTEARVKGKDYKMIVNLPICYDVYCVGTLALTEIRIGTDQDGQD